MRGADPGLLNSRKALDDCRLPSGESGSVAQLAGGVFAPRPDRAIGLDRQRGISCRRQPYDIGQSRNLRRLHARARAARAKLALGTDAPSPNRAVVLERQRVVVSGDHLHHAAEIREYPCLMPLVIRVVAANVEIPGFIKTEPSRTAIGKPDRRVVFASGNTSDASCGLRGERLRLGLEIPSAHLPIFIVAEGPQGAIIKKHDRIEPAGRDTRHPTCE